jgi:hypothetical protein
MLDSAIRELATSKDPVWIAAALFEKTVQIWDLPSQEKISEFPTVFCSGARNLALAPDAGIVATGLSETAGEVAAYEVPTGKKLWEQKLIYPSLLRFHPSGQSILCSNNQQSVFRLDAYTGRTLEVVDGVSQYIEGPYDAALSVPAQKERPFRLIAKGHSFDIDRSSFGLLDAQFSPHSVCLSEAAAYLKRLGAVRCLSCDDGRLQWRFDPGADTHVLRLQYCPRIDAFFGILKELNKKGLGSRRLVKFDATSGTCERVCDLNSWEEVFLDTEQLVNSRGEVRDLSNGALFGRLAFPLNEYPDD